MRIRVKFSKQNYVKFVGHLDTVRLFQRAIKAANIPIAYSQGFSPHALVYFAMPLSVGVSSISEYMDIITQRDVETEAVKEDLNKHLPKDIEILEVSQMPEKSDSLMSLVTVADYTIRFKIGDLREDFISYCQERLTEEEWLITKKSKKKFKEVNIRPLLYRLEIEKQEDEYIIAIQVAAGSIENLSPELLLKALIIEKPLEEIPYSIERTELYAKGEEGIIPLGKYGK